MPLADVAQEILGHAVNPPAAPNGQRVVNDVSPHFENFVIQRIRAHIIKEMQAIELEVAKELEHLKALFPGSLEPHIALTSARINALLKTLYK